MAGKSALLSMGKEMMGKTAGYAKAGIGLYQSLKAAKERKKAMQQYNDNPFQIPSSVTQAISGYGKIAQGSKMAGQDIMEENIAARTGEGIGAVKRAAQSPSQVLASTVDLYKQQQQQQQNLDLTAMGDYQTRQRGYLNALTTMAPYETKKWEYGTLFPVQARLNYASGLSASGQQNLATGLGAVMGISANQQAINGLNGSNSTSQLGGVNTAYDNAPSMGMQPMSYINPIRSTGVTFGG